MAGTNGHQSVLDLTQLPRRTAQSKNARQKKKKKKNRISISKNGANYERWESERRGNRDLKVVKEKEYGLSLIVANRSDGEVWEGREDDDPLPRKKERSELRAFVMRMGPNHVLLTPAVFFFFL